MEKKGLVRKGDGKDVDHRNHNTADNSSNNLQVQSKFVNRRDGGPGANRRDGGPKSRRSPDGKGKPKGKMVKALFNSKRKKRG